MRNSISSSRLLKRVNIMNCNNLMNETSPYPRNMVLYQQTRSFKDFWSDRKVERELNLSPTNILGFTMVGSIMFYNAVNWKLLFRKLGFDVDSGTEAEKKANRKHDFTQQFEAS